MRPSAASCAVAQPHALRTLNSMRTGDSSRPVSATSSSSSYARRLAILAMRLDDRQRQTRMLPSRDNSIRTCAAGPSRADLEPHEVVRVVDDAHLVGFGIANAHGREDETPCSLQTGRRGRGAEDPESPRARSGLLEETRRPPPASSRRPPTIRPALVSIDAAVHADPRLDSTLARADHAHYGSLDSLRGMKV